MKILLGYRLDHWRGRPVDCYARSFYRELTGLGHEVLPFGKGHGKTLDDYDIKSCDALIDLDNGRGPDGKFSFSQDAVQQNIPTAVWFIDSHGNPDLHRRLAKNYNHVFFAVWDKRDLFAKHKCAHWSPCATDLSWFDFGRFEDVTPQFDFGFIGSKGGLSRADPLREICEANSWTYQIRQVSKAFRHKWPYCGEAMAECKTLFNHGQKHDAPNQRVLESMALRRPLISDVDPRSGMDKLFREGYHYVGYEAYTYEGLEEKCRWVMDNPEIAARIAKAGYEEVAAKHTIRNRVEQIMEVLS